MTERFDAETIANHLKKKKEKMELLKWREQDGGEEAAQLREEEEVMFS